MPLGQLEAELQAPDITPDMYDPNTADDEDWKRWLGGLMNDDVGNEGVWWVPGEALLHWSMNERSFEELIFVLSRLCHCGAGLLPSCPACGIWWEHLVGTL